MLGSISPADVHKASRAIETWDAITERLAAAKPTISAYAPYLVVGVVVWILGVIFCDRASDELFLNQWVGRLIGILFPVVGPLVLLLLILRQRRLHYLD